MTEDELDELRRRNDIKLVELMTQFHDFVKQYAIDVARADKNRSDMLTIIESHDDFIRLIKPMYSKGMIALGAFCLGIVGAAAAWVWGHIKWG